MAQYEVFEAADGSLLLDCQSDLLRHYSTRFAVPLMPPGVAPEPAARLNPRFDVRGDPFFMVTQFAGAVPVSELRASIGSLRAHEYEITRALDMLMGGV